VYTGEGVSLACPATGSSNVGGGTDGAPGLGCAGPGGGEAGGGTKSRAASTSANVHIPWTCHGGLAVEREGVLGTSAKGMSALGRYGSIGIELLASMALGYYLGRYLDRRLGTQCIALVGFLLGCAAGFRNLWRTAKKMQAELEREDAKNPPRPPLD